MRHREAHPRNEDPVERDRAEAERLGELLDLAVSLRRDALDDMTARVAHELNQPLSVIVSNVRGAVRRLEASHPVNTRILQALDKAAAQAKRAAQVVERVRAELGVEQLSCEPLDIGRIARAALSIAARMASTRGVHVEAAIGDRPLPARGDPRRLKHALLVLLLDGIGRAQPVSGPNPILRLHATESGGFIEIGLHRQGGTPDAAQPASAFLAASTPASDIGIGLSFARSVVKAHGGRMEMHDEHGGEGGSVRIRLPKATTHDGNEE